ncbi:MAG TPA: hypothetical protein VGH33_27335 [Isosphaeraceae bacterium]
MPPGDEAAKPAAESEARALAKYNEMRNRAAMTVAAQSRLATWCEQNGLKAESTAHLANVVRLDPSRESAWRKLGFKKHDGRWMTDEQIAEDVEQKKADTVWSKRFRDWHKQIHGGPKQGEAQAALDEITDPKAVPTIYREFGVGGEKDQLIAVQLLGQIDSPVSSKTLAALAIYGKTPNVRRNSLETLRRRAPEDFLGMFVALLRDPLKYAVRPVGGPGSPGVLFVEGEQFNVQRFYDPPAPNLGPRFGQPVAYRMDGSPIVTQASTIHHVDSNVRVGKNTFRETDTDTTRMTTYSIPNAMLQAQQASMVAQGTLANDVAVVEAVNEQRKQFNELVMAAAQGAIGADPGKTPKAWRDYLAKKLNKYDKRPAASNPKPTLTELVPIAFEYSVLAQTSFLTNTSTRTYVDT